MLRLYAARLLFSMGRLFTRLGRGQMYFGIALLPAAVLRERIALAWDNFNSADDAIDSGLWEWEAETLRLAFRPGDSVLVIGAGTGRDVVAFARRGHDVMGVEPNSVAAARGREALAARSIDATIVTGLFLDVPITRSFDVITFSYQTYSYIPGAARRIAALAKAREHLNPGGRIVVSYCCGVRSSPRLFRVLSAGARLAGTDWRPEPGDTFTPIEHRSLVIHYEHTFSKEEIESEAAAAVLRISPIRTGPSVVVLVDASAATP